MSKKILVVASNYGVWNEELQAPWDILTDAGHDLTICTPLGKKPLPLAVSVDPDFIDPIQNYKVNIPYACNRMKALISSDVWDNPLHIEKSDMNGYDAIIMVGGLGADIDLANNPHLHRLIREAYDSKKIIGSICFSVAALVFTRNLKNKHRSIVYGKKIAAHPREWDFKSAVTYELYGATEDNAGTNVITPAFLIPLHDIAIDAVGPEGKVFADPKTNRDKPCVIYDWPFITACSVESSIAYGQKIAEVLAS